MRYCNQLLYGESGFVARCLQPFGMEHSHHDHTAEQASKLGIAARGRGYVKRAKRENGKQSIRQSTITKT